KTLCNSGDRAPFLQGTIDQIHRIGDAALHLRPVSLQVSGKLTACQAGELRPLAEGLRLRIRITSAPSPALRPYIGKWDSKPAMTIMGACGEVFRKILMLIFLPLLAITFLRTPLESSTISSIRRLGGGLLLANVLVAVFGLAIGAAVAVGMRHKNLRPD